MFGRLFRKIKTIFYKLFNPRFKRAKLYDCPKVYFKKNLKIGDNTTINDSVFIHAAGGVTIGKNCTISHGCTILSIGLDTNGWENRDPKLDRHLMKEVIIGDNVWLCANVTICPGSIIESNCVIAAGCVVNGKCESGYIYGGVPFQKKKSLTK